MKKYKFIKILHSGKEKVCATFDTTLDPEYHAYINWCNENGMGWKLVDLEGNIKYQSSEK